MERALTSIGITCLVGLFVLFLGRRRSTAPLEARSQGQILPPIVFDFGRWLLDRCIPLFRCVNVSPNTLSFLSIPVCAAASVVVASGHFGLGGVLLAVGFGLDAWDGALARALGVASDAGEVVDATIDRYTDVIVMLGFLYYFRDDLVPWLLTSAALVGTVAVSYVRAKGASFGLDADIGFMQRHERALWLAVATAIAPATVGLLEPPSAHPLHYPVIAALAVVATGTHVTAVRRVHMVVAALTARREAITAGERISAG
jgi:phosphatidylglycerophosphate synthase